MPNLIELNIFKIKDLELPCSILLNLKSLSLNNITYLKFITNENKISLPKLKYLYINNISLHVENKIKIYLDNLEYLDLRVKEQDGIGFDNNNNKSGFYKDNTINNLNNIFDLQFLEIYDIDTNKYKDDDEFHYDPDVFNYLIEVFNNPEKLFKEQNINKYNYFNFEIYHEYYHVCGSFHCNFKFTYKYLFSKTKSNKYLFKTIYTYGCDYEGSLIEYIEKEERYCEKIDYNNYYFINKDIKKKVEITIFYQK